MQATIADERAASGFHPHRRFLSGALDGLTPQVVAIVTALLLMRVLSEMVGSLSVAVTDHRLAPWLLRILQSVGRLWLNTAPMLIAIIATSNLGPQRGARRVAALTSAVVLSAGAGSVLRYLGAQPQAWPDRSSTDMLLAMLSYVWPRYALLGGMLTIVGEFYRRELASLRGAQQARIDHAAFEREMAETRLEVLQAQIEPHFLFNTLANVRRLYDKDAGAGASMLENLMRYLEVALPRMREAQSTLERDADLIESFLRIHRIRMGERLAFSIDVPLALRKQPVPPMMLLTLVENAVKHGLNPSPDGGLIRVVARADGDHLVVSVADTGIGFGTAVGAGTGLANIRARLAAEFGDRAGLELENNDLGGATARIVLPLSGRATA